MVSELEQLNARYGRPGAVSFLAHPLGGPAALLVTPDAQAEVALHGAHVLSFSPRGGAPVLWMSPDARIADGHGIRGGIPVCWPWFAGHATDPGKPDHGFVRKTAWRVAGMEAHDGLAAITLAIATGPEHAALWPHEADLSLTVTLTERLRLDLVTTNRRDESVAVTQALHSYFAVDDVRRVAVTGLEGAGYLDKLQDYARATQRGAIGFAGEVDRIYEDTRGEVVIADPGWRRQIRIAKAGSASTVVWNPWIEKSARLTDMPLESYLGMVCVETCNAGGDVVTLPPRGTHRLTAEISVAPL